MTNDWWLGGISHWSHLTVSSVPVQGTKWWGDGLYWVAYHSLSSPLSLPPSMCASRYVLRKQSKRRTPPFPSSATAISCWSCVYSWIFLSCLSSQHSLWGWSRSLYAKTTTMRRRRQTDVHLWLIPIAGDTMQRRDEEKRIMKIISSLFFLQLKPSCVCV